MWRWVSGGTLELNFNFGLEYDLTTFHFWNYHSEGFDVDDIDLTFFDASMALVGTILNVAPAIGNGSGSDLDPIFAEDLPLLFPSKVQFVNAVLSGSNSEADFNNIGFTGELSDPDGGSNGNGTTPVPEPGTFMLMLLGASVLGALKIRQAKQRRVTDTSQSLIRHLHTAALLDFPVEVSQSWMFPGGSLRGLRRPASLPRKRLARKTAGSPHGR